MTTKNVLTENELKVNLMLLKDKLVNTKLKPSENILFFNLEAYYLYLDKGSPCAISNIIKTLEPYIPLLLCMDSKGYRLLLNAAQSSNPKEINKIKNEFYKKAVFEFLNILKNSNTNEEIDYIFNLCNNLRIMQN